MKHFTILFFFVFIVNNAFTQTDLQPYENNPVVPKGASGSWDDSAVWWPNVTVLNDTFYMIYNGTDNWPSQPASIGLATSTDGFTFTKSASNPILTADGNGFDAYSVNDGALYFEKATWYLYYDGRSTTPNQPGNVIGRASADNPHGPWTRSNDTLLTVGSAGEWDDEYISPRSILPTDSGLIMYYWAGNTWGLDRKSQIGMATSTDGGLTWQKYDDPATTTAPFYESDPVLTPGSAGSYDDVEIMGCSVLRSYSKWEMFYSGDDGNSDVICYATSNDGITWEKHADNPILTPEQDPFATTNYLEGAAAAFWNNTYFIYYDIGLPGNGIGLSTSDTTTAIENKTVYIPSKLILYQNYPNPFNPKTTISYQLPVSSSVEISIYNILGQKVATLVNKKQPAGVYTIEWDATGFASGVYFYRLETVEGFVQTKKLVVLK